MAEIIYEVGNVMVSVEDGNCELLGLKATVDLIAVYEEDDYSRKNIGECIVYIFNDEEENIFISADAHSQRLTDMMCNTRIVTSQDERFDTLCLRNLVWTDEDIEYIDGVRKKGALLCGKVALIDDLSVDNSISPSLEHIEELLHQVLQKIYRIFSVDFFLADDRLYIDNETKKALQLEEENEVSEARDNIIEQVLIPNNETILKNRGFAKTGLSGYILKSSNYTF